jgi:alpha-1,6-mannosyltransferase
MLIFMATSMKNRIGILFVLFSIVLYYFIGYHIERSDLHALLLTVGILFLSYLYFIKQTFSIWAILLSGLLFRVVFTWSIPGLSQDFYRFIWDGELFLRGISPYTYVPEELIYLEAYQDLRPLYEGMGPSSARNFSNYPMLNQWLFALGSLSEHPRLIYRLVIVLSDVAVFWLLHHLILSFHHKRWALTAYFLNPLVIIEGTYNLHFEPVMLALLLAFIYALKHKRQGVAAVFFASSVFTKLLPLLLSPLLLRWLKPKELRLFTFGFLAVSILLIVPFSGPLWTQNWAGSIGLWFSNFEFNGALYRIFKEVGLLFGAHDYQLIKVYGYLHATGIVLLAGYFSLRSTNLNQFIRYSEWLLLAYLLSSPTIHPWYLITLVGLASLRKSALILLWSATVFLSYTAYTLDPVELPLWVTVLEYVPIVVLAYFSSRSFSRS